MGDCWMEAYNKINFHNDYDGWNISNDTKNLGFEEKWDLGGDDGHYDFILWLKNYFSYEHPELAKLVYISFLKASEDIKRAYDPVVLFSLDLFLKKGKQEYPIPSENEDIDPMDFPEFKNWINKK